MHPLTKSLTWGLCLLTLLTGASSCTQWPGEVLESQYQYPLVPDPTYSFSREGASSVDTQLSERAASASAVLYDRFLRRAYLRSESSWTELVTLFDEGGNNEIALRPLLVPSALRSADRQAYLADFTELLEQVRQAGGYEAGAYSIDRYNRPAAAGVSGFIGYNQGDEDRVFATPLGLVPSEQYLGMLSGALYLDRLLSVDLQEGYLRDPQLIRSHEDLVFVPGHNYTALEHHWDEAYGCYTELERQLRSTTLPGVSGFGRRIADAFALGRRALTEYRYGEALEHLRLIRELLAGCVARRAMEDLSGRNTLANLAEDPRQAFRFISRGLGYTYALQFLLRPSGEPYLSRQEVAALIQPVLQGEGLWSSDLKTKLYTLSGQISATFFPTATSPAGERP